MKIMAKAQPAPQVRALVSLASRRLRLFVLLVQGLVWPTKMKETIRRAYERTGEHGRRVSHKKKMGAAGTKTGIVTGIRNETRKQSLAARDAPTRPL